MDNLTKQQDTDKIIAEQLNDRDLLNLCIAQPNLRICKDDVFWRDRLFSKYGQLTKSESKTWKTLYLQIIYYLDKNQNNIYRNMQNIIKKGDRDLVDFFDKQGFRNWNQGIHDAAREGHGELVEYFISKGANNWNWAIVGASQGGHRDLVNYFISLGGENYSYNWNSPMIYAAARGYRDLVDLFISKGADQFDVSLLLAIKGGHLDLVDLFIEKGANNWFAAAKEAIDAGNKDLVLFFLDKEDSIKNEENQERLQRLIEKKETKWALNLLLKHAERTGNKDIVDALRKRNH